MLIPHRDAGRLLDAYREKLFAAGFYGAYSFPAAAPLAAVSRAFSRGELKELARNIRALTAGSGGKIQGGGIGSAAGIWGGGPAAMGITGPVLNLQTGEGVFPVTGREKILRVFSPPVLCAALTGPDETPFPIEAPALSFRAAALANLSIRPLDPFAGGEGPGYPAGSGMAPPAGQEGGSRAEGFNGYSYGWKTGPLVWLPAR